MQKIFYIMSDFLAIKYESAMPAKLPLIAAAIALTLAAGPATYAQAPSTAPPGNPVGEREDARSSPLFGPLIKAYYELCVTELGKGADKVDAAAFEQKSYALFRAVAVSKGVSPDALQEHLKAIPRQVILIVKRDPKTLDSVETFTDALVGPDWASACARSPECSQQQKDAARQTP
jgi:hypothetical protein